VRRLLVAVRDRIDAAVADADHAPLSEAGCSHPIEARVDTGVMGRPSSFICRACGLNTAMEA
jgi:hypothetical protein